MVVIFAVCKQRFKPIKTISTAFVAFKNNKKAIKLQLRKLSLNKTKNHKIALTKKKKALIDDAKKIIFKN